MRERRYAVAALLLLFFFLFISGCTVSRSAGHVDVARLVEQRSGFKTHWDQGSLADAEVAKVVAGLIGNSLTREHAIEIALVNNRALQATYEELDISQADMVQAGLLKNPTLGFSFGVPLTSGGTEFEGSLVQDFLDLLVLPMRKKIARERFTAEILRVAHQVLQVAAEVSKQFAAVQATVELCEFRRTVVAVTQAAADLSSRQYEAGNVNELAQISEQTGYEQAQVELEHAELDTADARERLNRLLGLWGPQTGWTLAHKLAEPPAAEPALEKLEEHALRWRLDVDAARKQVALLTRAVAMAKNFRLFGRIEVGVHGHQDPNGPRLLGPTLSLELPIFDQRQAQIARLLAEQRQSEHRLQALAVDTRAEVRLARAQLLGNRRILDRYRTRLLPLRSRIVDLSQLYYNGMLLGAYQLLTAKQTQMDTYRMYVEALRDYWAARAELERAVGGRLITAASGTDSVAAPGPDSTAAPTPNHEGHPDAEKSDTAAPHHHEMQKDPEESEAAPIHHHHIHKDPEKSEDTEHEHPTK